jgi:hypothetical protein
MLMGAKKLVVKKGQKKVESFWKPKMIKYHTRTKIFEHGYHRNHFEPKHFYTSTILDLLLFLGGLEFFSIFEIITNFGVYPMCQKIASQSIWIQNV